MSDFLVTIPFGFVAEKFGIRVVLWCNLAPRVFLSVWALIVGSYHLSRCRYMFLYITHTYILVE